MEQQQNEIGQQERVGEWSEVDELNWAADRSVLRDLKIRGEEPSEWLANEYRELTSRRLGVSRG